MSSFQDGLKGFGPDERKVIEQKMQEWALQTYIGRHVEQNITAERFLPAKNMEQLLDVFVSFHNNDIWILAEKYRDACRANVGQGGAIRSKPLPKVLGRAVEKASFVNYLKLRYPKYFRLRAHAEDFIQRLVLGGNPTRYEASFQLSRYSTWVIWDVETRSSNPFHFVKRGRANEVRGSLGLDPKRSDPRGLLLLIYERDGHLTLHRPTVADAGLHPFFAPPPTGIDDYGLTKPWPPGISGLEDFQPRPEAVHGPTYANVGHLNLPPRVLR